MELDLNKIIIQDPIYNKKNKSFVSLIENGIFESNKIRIIDITNSTLTLKFVNHINDIDEFIISESLKNGKQWFGSDNLKYNTLKDLYNESIINNNMMINNIDINAIEDINGDELNIDNLNINNEISCVFNIKEIVFLEDKFYLNLIINKMIVNNYAYYESEYLFVNSESE
jgi:hypothetical protein